MTPGVTMANYRVTFLVAFPPMAGMLVLVAKSIARSDLAMTRHHQMAGPDLHLTRRADQMPNPVTRIYLHLSVAAGHSLVINPVTIVTPVATPMAFVATTEAASTVFDLNPSWPRIIVPRITTNGVTTVSVI